MYSIVDIVYYTWTLYTYDPLPDWPFTQYSVVAHITLETHDIYIQFNPRSKGVQRYSLCVQQLLYSFY